MKRGGEEEEKEGRGREVVEICVSEGGLGSAKISQREKKLLLVAGCCSVLRLTVSLDPIKGLHIGKRPPMQQTPQRRGGSLRFSRVSHFRERHRPPKFFLCT